MRRVFVVSRAIVLLAIVAALSGCAGGAPSASTPVANNAFSYACAAGGDCGAFMTISNPGGPANKLMAATTTVTDRAELHTMVKNDQGTMMMKQVDNIAVPAAGSVELKPGSFHVMLFGLNKELKVGDTFPLTLKFEQGGESTVQVQVKAKN
jgi:hypothetical protein